MVPMAAPQVARIAIQIAGAHLAAAHEVGIVPRDIKTGQHHDPARRLCEGPRFWIGEAARARRVRWRCRSRSRRPARSLMGTTGLHVHARTASRTDLSTPAPISFSLGVVLYEMVVGHASFSRQNRRRSDCGCTRTRSRCSSAVQFRRSRSPLEAIIDRCLRKDQNQRYQNADSLLDDLHEFQLQMTSNSRSVAVPPLKKTSWWRWAAIATAAGTAYLAISSPSPDAQLPAPARIRFHNSRLSSIPSR